MADERRHDPAEMLLKAAATWEPPDGFALRVIAAARSDPRRETQVPRSLAVIDATGQLRAYVTALGARRRSAVWVLRQYWHLLRGQ